MTTYLYRFAKLTNFLKEHRKLVILISAGAFLFFGFSQVYAIDFIDGAQFAAGVDPLTMVILLLTGIVNALAWAIGQLIVLLLGILIIPILSYNNFGNSAIIDIGWPLVRDVVNMFVIVILLVIAIKTIISSKSANWEQQLPRLFLAVIFVNFSRTITLLIVDAGQVVMFTFVNALRDIAAGNFVNLFQINEILALGDPGGLVTESFEAFGFLGTAYVNLVLLGIVLAVILVLGIVFVYRIIMIWVLVILSPIAFFMHGVKDVLPQAAGQASKWWDKLVGVVTLGPILVFFLWLGLAAATSGPIASSEGFDAEQTEDSVMDLYADIFNMEQLLSLMIGIILIMVGFQAASGAAGAMGGIAATLVNEKSGKAIAKNVAKMPAAAGYRVARGVGRRALASKTGREAMSGLSSGFRDLGGKVAKSGIPGGAMIGGAIISGSGKAQRALTANQLEERREARKDLAGRPPEEVAAMYAASRNAIPATSAGVMQREELITRMTEDDDVAKVVRDDMVAQHGAEKGQAMFDKHMTEAFAHRESTKGTLDKDEKKKYQQAKEEKIRFLPEKDQEKVIDKMNREGRLHKMTGEDASDPRIQKMLGNMKGAPFVNMQTGEETERNLLQQMLASKGLRKSAREGLQGKGVEFSKTDSAGAAVGTQPNAERIQTALEHGSVSGVKIEDLEVKDLNANAANITRASVDANADWSKADAAVQTVARPHLRGDRDNAANNVVTRDKAAAALHLAGETADSAFALNADGNSTNERKGGLQAALKIKPTAVVNVENHIDNALNADSFNDATEAASQAITATDIDALVKQHDETADNAVRTEIRKTLEVAGKALRAEGFRPEDERGLTNKQLKELTRKNDLAIKKTQP